MSSIRPDRPQLVTLGRLALLDGDGRDLVSPEAGKLLAVLAYLAAAPGRRVTRDHLIDLFWADSPLPKARNALRQLIYKLREVLGDELIPHGSGIDVCLASTLAADRDEFLAALNRGDHAAAIALYLGPYAPGIVSAGSAGFEQWADREREALHDLFTNAADLVARHALDAGDAATAVRLAQQLLADQPSDEKAWRLLLEAEGKTGRRVHLAADIAELKRRAAEEGRELEPRTLRLVESLSTGADTTHAHAEPSGIVADLVGREREFALLYGAWHRVASTRHGAHLHVTGAAGLGKSRCLGDLALRLRTERVRVVMVRTTPRQRSLPDSLLAALVAAVAELPGAGGVSERCARYLVDLQPSVAGRFPNATPLETSDPIDRRRARTEALHDLLLAVSDDVPVALLLDDAHWWDRSSSEVVADLIERSEHRALLFVTASRPGAEAIHTAITGTAMVLTPLTSDEIAALVLSLGEHADVEAIAQLASGLLAATDGVPLHVLEALRLGLDRGMLGLNEGRWEFLRLAEFVTSLRPGLMLTERINALELGQRELLLLVALFEQPCDAPTAEALGLRAAHGAFLELERLGMVVPKSIGWVVAHDTIAQAVQDAASAAQLRTAHARLGALLLRRAATEPERVEGIRHLIDAEERIQLRAACSELVTWRRSNGDRRSGRLILAELLGGVTPATTLAALVAALPPRLRRRKRRLEVSLPVGVAVGALLMGFVWWRSMPPPGAETGLAFVRGDDPSGIPLVVHLRAEGWSRGEGPLHASSGTALLGAGHRQVLRIQGPPNQSPDGTKWLASIGELGTLGPTELLLVDSHGKERRIAPAPGDDVWPDWSPDGTMAVFGSTRWSPRTDASFALGIVEVATGAVRRLTTGDDSDEGPLWSPGGTRIAFMRRHAELAPDAVCWITIDGTMQRCMTPPVDAQALLGWLDGGTMLLSLGIANGEGGLAALRLSDNTITRISAGDPANASLSPDGQWVTCQCHFPEVPPGSAPWFVFPSLRPELRRQVTLGADTMARYPAWAPMPRQSIARLSISAPPAAIALNARFRLGVRAVSDNNTPVAVPAEVMHWASRAPGIVMVDSMNGDLSPRALGTAWIVASAGGWRRDSVRVTIGPQASSPLVTDAWDGDWGSRWATFGESPKPDVVTDSALGRAFTPNGAGRYDNGVYTRTTFSGTAGLGVEAVVRAPITRRKWQRLRLVMATIQRWTPSGPDGVGCGVQYPSSEGWPWLHFMGVPGGAVRVPDELASGKPFRVRVQLFPDGSCGVAIDGRMISRAPVDVPTNGDFTISLRGQSVGTRMLVGPLTVWSGVKPDVNWGTAERDSVPPVRRGKGRQP